MSPKFAFTPLPTSASDARDSLAASIHGTWRGQFIDHAGNTQAFSLLRERSVDAAVVGRFLFFTTYGVAPTGVKLLEASGNSFVALAGPYYDPTIDSETILVLEGARTDASIEGTFYQRIVGQRDNIREGRFVATASEPANRAA